MRFQFGFLIIALAMMVLITGCGSPAPAPTAAPTLAPTVTTARPTSVPAQPTSAPVATSVPAPTATTARPTTAPAQPTVAPTVPAVTSANYNGEWQGTSAKDSPLSFEIAENEMRYLNVNYSVESGACQFLSGSRGESKMNPPIAVIKTKDLNIQMDFGDGYSLVLTGVFASNTEASGKLVFKGNSRSCGAFEINTTWSAKKGTAAASGAMTAPANPAASKAELEKSVRAFFDALNTKNLDAALKFVDDNVVFNIATTTTGLGKAQLRTYLQGQISRGVTYTLGEVKAADDEVTFSLKTGPGAVTTNNSITFDDGKMDFLMWK